MKMFSQNDECRKCGCTHFSSQWSAAVIVVGGGVVEYTVGMHGNFQEAIINTCGNCGFRWVVAPLDQEPKP